MCECVFVIATGHGILAVESVDRILAFVVINPGCSWLGLRSAFVAHCAEAKFNRLLRVRVNDVRNNIYIFLRSGGTQAMPPKGEQEPKGRVRMHRACASPGPVLGRIKATMEKESILKIQRSKG